MTHTPNDITDAWPLHRTGSNAPSPVSHEHTHTTGENTQDADDTAQNNTQGVGDITPVPSPAAAAGDDAHVRARIDVLAVTNRLRREGYWDEGLEDTKRALFKDARKISDDKDIKQQWVYGELDRMYPPLDKRTKTDMYRKASTDTQDRQGDDGQIQGLSEIPSGWPELPANASLPAEVGWVQANRLRVVEERPGRATLVRLDQALSPAPSWAALGWLETSIRSYAKYVDVASKATSTADDEASVMRHERMAIEEVKRLLAEMEEAEGGRRR